MRSMDTTPYPRCVLPKRPHPDLPKGRLIIERLISLLRELDLEVVGGGSTDDDGTWIEPLGGVRLNMELPYRTGLDFFVDIGGLAYGDDSSLSFDIGVAFQWEIVDHVALEIGFRHFQTDLERNGGDFEFDTSLAGLFGSVAIRF